MDINFISKYNIESIYDDINALIVKTYNYNLENEIKYRKIIKKLTKTIYTTYNNNTNLNNININEFNKLVLDKSVPFLLKDINNNNNNNNIVSSNAIVPTITSLSIKSTPIGSISNDVNNTLIDTDNTKITKKPKIRTKRRKKKDKNKLSSSDNLNMSVFDSYNQDQLFVNNDKSNSNSNNSNYDKFLENQNDFSDQIKEANKKIKENLKIITSNNSNEGIFKKEDHTKDINKDINKFEQIIENNINKQTDSDNDKDNINNSYKSPLDNALDNYEGEKINETLTRVLLKQKDYSKNNELESYKGEEYVGNLIKPIGEQAPIQPLLYQNSSQGAERIIKQTFIVDSGLYTGDPRTPTLSTVTNLNSDDFWSKFKVSLIDTIKIDKLCDIYLRNVSINGGANIDAATPGQCFVIDIEEFNINYSSNNPNLKDKIVILNTGPAVAGRINVNYPTQSYYITSLNPSKIKQLTFNLSDQDGDSTAGCFFEAVGQTNRLIMSFEIVSRAVKDEFL